MESSGSWGRTVFEELSLIWRFIIPDPQDMIPVTLYTIHNVLFPLVPLLLMGYLVRRPNTHLYRLALMPFTIWTILRASFGYVWVNEEFGPYNFGQGLFGIASVGKAIEYGFVKAGRFKNGEGTLGQSTFPAIDRMTANQPSAVSSFGLDTPSSQATPTKEEHLNLPKSEMLKSPSDVALAYALPANGHVSSARQKPIKSPSGVTLAFRESYSSGANTPANGRVTPSSTGPRKSSSSLRGLVDAIEVIGSVRGIGWDWGKGLYTATETRPLDRSGFIKATLQTFILSFLALDIIESSLKLLPPFRNPAGGSIFFMEAPPAFLADHTLLFPIIRAYPKLGAFIVKYAVSTGISFLMGLAIIAGFEMCYALLTLLCVGLLGHNTESWPPVFDRPWRATSLADFWGRRWHQTLRQTFFIFGGYPLQWMVDRLLRPIMGQENAASYGRVGLVLGTFIASGLFHGLSIYGMGEGGVDHAATVYFTNQGLLLLAERGWRKVTGKRVEGWWGTIWTYAAVLFGIESCMDGWSKRGLVSGLIIPPILSPTRLFLFPVLIRFLE